MLIQKRKYKEVKCTESYPTVGVPCLGGLDTNSHNNICFALAKIAKASTFSSSLPSKLHQST